MPSKRKRNKATTAQPLGRQDFFTELTERLELLRPALRAAGHDPKASQYFGRDMAKMAVIAPNGTLYWIEIKVDNWEEKALTESLRTIDPTLVSFLKKSYARNPIPTRAIRQLERDHAATIDPTAYDYNYSFDSIPDSFDDTTNLTDDELSALADQLDEEYFERMELKYR